MKYEETRKILFRHCDPAGIVFYPRYFEMVNDLVEAFFDNALDWPFEELLKTRSVPTAEIRLRFRAPSRHGDHIRLGLKVTKLGRTSMRLAFSAQSTDAELRFEGESVLVNIDDAGSPCAWPARIRDLIEAEQGK
jgi:4-hydroxybenzoyl-CoA thioesterase